MNENGTAVTAADTQSAAGAAGELEQIREGGRALVEKRKELNKLTRQIEGLQWGNVNGASLSPAARYALAELVYIARANPQLHIDMLGGKPYLNSQYWADRINSDEYFLGYRQREISTAVTAQLRARAEVALKEAAELADDPDMKAHVQELKNEAYEARRQAREYDTLRAECGAPDFALSVVETVIERFRPGAPLDAITRGEADPEHFKQIIIEYNWAPRLEGTKDPIGLAEPAKTARTRSMRRAAVKGFSAWMVPLEKDLRRIEDAVEAEYRIIDHDERAAAEQRTLPAGQPQQVQTGSGEPRQPDAKKGAPSGVEVGNAFADADEKNAALKRFFANLKESGVDSGDRAAWARERGLPESISSWGPQEHSKALELLIGPERDEYLKVCKMIGADPGDFAQEKLGGAPEGLADYRELRRLANEVADSDGAEQGSLV